MRFPDAQVAFCPKHLEPLRAEWPKGYGVLCVKLWDRVVRDPRFEERFPLDPATGLRQFDEGKAEQLLLDFSPLCCFVGDEVMADLVGMALGGVQ